MTNPSKDIAGSEPLDRTISKFTDGAVSALKAKYQFNHSGRQALEMMADEVKIRADKAIKDYLAAHDTEKKQQVLSIVRLAKPTAKTNDGLPVAPGIAWNQGIERYERELKQAIEAIYG